MSYYEMRYMHVTWRLLYRVDENPVTCNNTINTTFVSNGEQYFFQILWTYRAMYCIESDILTMEIMTNAILVMSR